MTDIIDQAIGCQQCQRPLGNSPSPDFCEEDCQELWHAKRSDLLRDQDEPVSGLGLYTDGRGGMRTSRSFWNATGFPYEISIVDETHHYPGWISTDEVPAVPLDRLPFVTSVEISVGDDE